MKVLILSDLHGNLEGLEAITEPWDELWVLGDLVNYGPNPAEVVDVVRRRVVNPGIVGQPKQGFPQACYAVREDRRLRLESRPYRAEVTAEKLRGLPVSAPIASQLGEVLLRGTPPVPAHAMATVGIQVLAGRALPLAGLKTDEHARPGRFGQTLQGAH